MVYVAMSGAREIMHRQTTNNHNLSNINTTGFKADLDNMLSNPVRGPGHSARVYATAGGTLTDLTPGSIFTTGRELDIALDDEGFIAVRTNDGKEAYTRAGELRVSADGVLETFDGNLVMGNNGPIAVPPYDKLLIGKDGTISVQPIDGLQGVMVEVDRIKLVNPDPARLEKGPDGLMRIRGEQAARDWTITISSAGAEAQQDVGEEGAAAVLPPDPDVAITSGALEASNVNSVQSLVTMVSLSRQYELMVKMMKTAEEIDTSANSLVRLE
jgi:flagellar basal-body rod protein FlgF